METGQILFFQMDIPVIFFSYFFFQFMYIYTCISTHRKKILTLYVTFLIVFSKLFQPWQISCRLIFTEKFSLQQKQKIHETEVIITVICTKLMFLIVLCCLWLQLFYIYHFRLLLLLLLLLLHILLHIQVWQVESTEEVFSKIVKCFSPGVTF